MRILLISWEYPPFVVGGMGKHVAELLPALATIAANQDDLQVDVLTTRSAGGATVEQVSDRVTIYRTDIPPIDPSDLFNSVIEGNRTLEARAQRLAEIHSYSVIHVHDWLTARAGISLKHAWKVPLIVTIHATERGRHQSHLPNVMSHQINQLEWEVCYEAWHIIVCSGYMSGELRGYFNIPLDKISVIPNGIDPAPLQILPGRRGQTFARPLCAQPRTSTLLRWADYARKGIAGSVARHAHDHRQTAERTLTGRRQEQRTDETAGR